MMRVLVTALALTMPLMAAAAGIPVLQPSLEISAAPTVPLPGQSVTITVRSYSGNQDETAYLWTVNGAVVDQGLGRDTITVTAGGLGSETVVTVTAREGEASRGSASISIRPADVDIVWEGRTYVPPLSDIRPLPNGASVVTFVAVPQVVGADGASDPGSLIYTWRVNNGAAPALRGRGKSTFTLTPPRFSNPFSVSVEVATPDGSARATRSVTVQPKTPEILFYEVGPLLGIRFDRAIAGSFSLSDEGTFEAFPIYIAPGDTTATAAWTVNGALADAVSDNARQITLRKTGTGAGEYTIGFSYASARIFENIEKSFMLAF